MALKGEKITTPRTSPGRVLHVVGKTLVLEMGLGRWSQGVCSADNRWLLKPLPRRTGSVNCRVDSFFFWPRGG